MADGIISGDQRGTGDAKTYGADVAPTGPVQDMWAYDPIAGTFPPLERDASPEDFTGGTGGAGLGGMAEPQEDGGDRYERRGF